MGKGAELCGMCEAGVLLPSAEQSMGSLGTVDMPSHLHSMSLSDCPLLWLITSVVTCLSLSSLPIPSQECALHSCGHFYTLFLLN